MIKAGDKLIIIAKALEDERNGTVYVKLTSDSQSHLTMLTENCKKAPTRPDWCPLVEIVTCKDCKHKIFLASDGKENTTYMCVTSIAKI